MDVDIKEEFTAVRAEVTAVRTEVHAVRAEVHEVRAEVHAVRAEVQEVDTRLSAQIRRVESTLRQEVWDEGAATRRHFDVVAESLRDDIRIIAEGLIALDAKVEAMRDSR